jgi:hypothetical protein
VAGSQAQHPHPPPGRRGAGGRPLCLHVHADSSSTTTTTTTTGCMWRAVLHHVAVCSLVVVCDMGAGWYLPKISGRF